MHRATGQTPLPDSLPSEPGAAVDGDPQEIHDIGGHPRDGELIQVTGDAREPVDLTDIAPASQATWHDGRLLFWPASKDQPGAQRRAFDTPVGSIETLALVATDHDLAELDQRAHADDAGDSLRCFGRLLGFARSAVAREQFYPSAHREDERVQASWRLLIGDERDVERLEAFAAAMPGACFAGDDPKHDRLESVESFLNACCDALVRRSLVRDEFFANVHDRAADPAADAEVRWVSALLHEDYDHRVVEGRRIDVATLLDKVQGWTARLGDAGGEPWQLGLVLAEPQLTREPAEETAEQTDGSGEETEQDETSSKVVVPAAEQWPLRFRLIPPPDLRDVHVALPARQVWSQPAGSIGFVGRNAVRLRERLASELRRAAEVCSPLHRALAESQPEEVVLTSAEAFRLMRDWSEILAEHGIDVQLPAWANKQENRLDVVMDLRPLDGSEAAAAFDGTGASLLSTVGLDSLLSFDWKVAVGGEQIDVDEFRRLVAQQSPLVRRNGQWVEIDPQAARAAADLMQAKPSGTMTLGEAFRTGFGLGRTTDGNAAPAVRLAGTRWVEELLSQSPDARAKEIPQPQEFTGTLRPYQLRGLQWLAFLDRLGLGGVLADDMGLGKTIQLIALLLHERASRAEGVPCHPTLLFVPTSVLGNWQRELARFAPNLRTMLHHGPQRPRGDDFREAAEQVDVVVTSYALSHRDAEDLRRVTWSRVALDEAQKIKNPTAASSVAVRSIEAPRKVALTGTPVENHLGELWSIMDLLNPGLLGTQGEFREKFATPIEKQGDRGRARRLREMIKPFVLRRTKDDPDIISDLPAKMEMNVFCGLTPEQAALYEKITGEMLGRIDTATGIRRRGLILSVLTKLKQVCDHPALLDPESPRTLIRSGKSQRLAEMLEEVIEEGEKALIFTQYRQMGDMLVEMLEKRLKRDVLFLHGGTPQQKRDEMVQRFQNSTGNTAPPVFLLSLRAGGLGLNLTAASHVFHFDRWWNPAVENQATDRAHRIGQQKRVQVHKFVCMGTVEERIDKMLQEKSQLAANIVGSGDEWLTELSTGELREYLSLSRDALSGGDELEDDDTDDASLVRGLLAGDDK